MSVRSLPMHGVNLTDEWHTPPELVRPLGKFDLDPAASQIQRQHFADVEYVYPEQDGRILPWRGRVWCNPPYSELMVWTRRFVTNDNGIFLVPARTETEWFRLLWKHCSGIFFTHRRINFIRGSTGEVGRQQVYGSVFAACGPNNLDALRDLPIPGTIVTGREIRN